MIYWSLPTFEGFFNQESEAYEGHKASVTTVDAQNKLLSF